MLDCGASQSRCPSPCPRMFSGKICTSSAFQVPSPCEVAAVPMNSPCLMSSSERLTTPRMTALSASTTLSIGPSFDLIESVWPSTCSIMPRTRTVVCANAATLASKSAAPAASQIRPGIVKIIIASTFFNRPSSAPLPLCAGEGKSKSHRRRNLAPDRYARRRQRAVAALRGARNEDHGTGLELGFFTRRKRHDRGVLGHLELLFAFLVFEGEDLTLDLRHRLGDRRVGHGAFRHQIPAAMSLAGAAHRLGEDQHFERARGLARLRHCGDADEIVR